MWFVPAFALSLSPKPAGRVRSSCPPSIRIDGNRRMAGSASGHGLGDRVARWVGPVAGILAAAASNQVPIYGAALLFAYSIGLGIRSSSWRLVSRVRADLLWLRRHGPGTERFGGGLLVATGARDVATAVQSYPSDLLQPAGRRSEPAIPPASCRRDPGSPVLCHRASRGTAMTAASASAARLIVRVRPWVVWRGPARRGKRTCRPKV